MEIKGEMTGKLPQLMRLDAINLVEQVGVIALKVAMLVEGHLDSGALIWQTAGFLAKSVKMQLPQEGSKLLTSTDHP